MYCLCLKCLHSQPPIWVFTNVYHIKHNRMLIIFPSSPIKMKYLSMKVGCLFVLFVCHVEISQTMTLLVVFLLPLEIPNE